MRSALVSHSEPTGTSSAGVGLLEQTRKRILVVDDDALVLNSLRRLLEALDVDVVTSTDPVQAVGLFERETFDLVISDERMPKMSGLDVLGKVRAGSPRTPTILLTGFNTPEMLERAYERCGVYRFVTKPWDNRELVSTVLDALRAAAILNR